MLCTCLDFLVLPVLVTTPFTHLQLKTLNTGHFSKIHCVAPQPASQKLSFSLLSPACHSWIPGNIRLQPHSITLLSDAHPPTLSTAPRSPPASKPANSEFTFSTVIALPTQHLISLCFSAFMPSCQSSCYVPRSCYLA